MDNADQLKGRVKEAAGDLTDDDHMKHEGRADQAEGKVKEVVDTVREKAGKVADKLTGRDDR